jgi:hypothetical protein
MNGDIIKEGYSSYFRNSGRLENPYPEDSQEFLDFERGWSQAIRQNPNVEFREKIQKPKEYVPKKPNPYADRRG